MDEFLKEQGYTLFKNHIDVSTGNSADLFQKKYDIDGKYFFIDIKRVDMTPVYSRERVLLDPLTYTMETSFEMKDGKWANINFYTFREKVLRDKLDEYEKKILSMWVILEGRGRT